VNDHSTPLLDVYYNHNGKPDVHKFDTVDIQQWQLDWTPHITEKDKAVLRKYRTGLLEFIDRAIVLCKAAKLRKPSAIQTMESERHRIDQHLVWA